MIEQLQNTLKLIEKEQLIKKLELSEYAFAVWRMPNETETQLVISLGEVEKLKDFQLSKLNTGFLVNKFADNHPISPYFISGDIILRANDVLINPTIKSSQIDKFMEDLEKENDAINAKESSSHTDAGNDFEASVEAAIHEIKAGKFEKAVLSRFKDVALTAHFSSWTFFQQICSIYSNAFVSMTFIPENGLWIGATPELLLSDSNKQFKTVSLAGTKTLESDQNLSEIAWTQKEIEEQAFVSRYIINCFKKIRLREFHEHGPKTIQAGNLAHLKTEFIVDYEELSFDNLSDQMLELLHPTSAVCGMPIESSKPWIEKVENYDREFYSGFLGPVNFENSSNLFVNLRCMKIAGNKARFFAGAGITEDSIASKEFLETEMKMNVLMSMFIQC
ncbi:chorismate-binding protein [Ekhidna sp. To15]|uniref:chorismate-binding protein n=1 Tax=Ekhidna sp. To15 TaxID=3395267 RepID=UPI003F51FDDA